MAEAFVLYRAGHQWWPDRDFEAKYIAPEQEARREVDAWEPLVHQWLDGTLHTDAYGNQVEGEQVDVCTIAEVATKALNIPIGQISRAIQMRISGILTAMGWDKVHRMTGAVFIRPKKETRS